MGLFSRDKYTLVNIDTKETIWEGKEFLTKESVLEDIANENLGDSLYRLELWSGGRKAKNSWVMRKPRTPKSPEELAAKSREDAEAFIAQDAADIKDRVEAHKKFADKVRQTYGIEGGGVDNIKLPTAEDGKISIISAANQAIAESTYLGIRETKPAEVAATVKTVMDSGTTILAGIAQMIATRMADSNNRNKKSVEKKKEEPEKKKKTSEPEKKEPEIKKKKVEPKEVPTYKEDIGEGITKTTFGTEQDTSTSVTETTTSSLYNGSDTPKGSELPVTYEQYERDMLGINKEVEEEEQEK